MRTTTKKTEIGEELKAAVTRVAVPSKMTAAVLYGSEDLRIEMIDVPALAADEVLLRVRLALTDGTDLKVWKRGYHARMIQPPAVFGHELVGDVVAVCKRVDPRWRIGMRVVANEFRPVPPLLPLPPRPGKSLRRFALQQWRLRRIHAHSRPHRCGKHARSAALCG